MRRSRWIVVAVTPVVVGLGCSSAGTTTQVATTPTAATTPAGSVSTMSGVFTEDQATRGGTMHQQNCSSCHGTEAYSGEAFTRRWATQPAFALFELIRTTMPADNPGSLTRKQYADIVAYVFKLNGAPAGRQELSDDKAALERIVIQTRGSLPQP